MYGIYENGNVIAKFTSPLTIRSNQPIYVSDALSLKRFVSKRSAQRWEIETGVEPLSYNAQDLMVSLVTKGHSDVVQVLMPQNFGVLKSRVVAATPATTAIAAANATTVSLSNLNSVMPKGTFIKFSNHSKIYLTTTALSGSGTVGIFPPLLTSLSTGVTVYNADNVLMDCYYDTDTTKGMAYSDGILMDMGTLKLVEKL